MIDLRIRGEEFFDGGSVDFRSQIGTVVQFRDRDDVVAAWHGLCFDVDADLLAGRDIPETGEFIFGHRIFLDGSSVSPRDVCQHDLFIHRFFRSGHIHGHVHGHGSLHHGPSSHHPRSRNVEVQSGRFQDRNVSGDGRIAGIESHLDLREILGSVLSDLSFQEDVQIVIFRRMDLIGRIPAGVVIEVAHRERIFSVLPGFHVRFHQDGVGFLFFLFQLFLQILQFLFQIIDLQIDLLQSFRKLFDIRGHLFDVQRLPGGEVRIAFPHFDLGILGFDPVADRFDLPVEVGEDLVPLFFIEEFDLYVGTGEVFR